MAACGPDQMAIVDHGTPGRGDAARFGIDRDDLLTQPKRDVALRPEAFGTDQDPLEGLVAGQIILRQGRALIGRIGFFADHRDRARKPLLPQRDRGLRAGMAGADDQNIIGGGRGMGRHLVHAHSLGRNHPACHRS